MSNNVISSKIYNNVNFKSAEKPNVIIDTNKEATEKPVAVPVPTLVAYMLKSNGAQNADKIQLKFSVPIETLEKKYENFAKQDIKDLSSRAGKSGQVLNWIGVLPQTQLQRIDKIYDISNSMKNSGGKKLGIIGIGGSKHTIENLLSLNEKNDDVVFLSAVDPKSMDKFIEKLGDLKTANILVASKSGTTLEPSTGYDYVEKAFVDKFKSEYLKEGLSEQDALLKAKEETAKHFVCVTDMDSSKSKLRGIAQEKGYKCGIIHDDCGGRFGAFDDHSLISLAYLGMSKEDMTKMLEASLKAQKKFMNEDLKNNLAIKRAIFNTDCILSGKTNQYDYYFGDVFEGTKLWNTQMKKESHKSSYRVSGDLIGPEFLHNSTESDLDSNNKTSFYTFNTIKNDGSENYKAYNALVNGSYKAYSAQHPTSIIELKDLSPESIAEFVELKHFEAMYTGMLLRTTKGEQHPEILPEVLQPNVSIYKKEVKELLKN